MVWRELLVAQIDAVERHRPDLVKANGQPRPAAADKKAVHTGWMNDGNERRVPDATNQTAACVKDPEPEQFRAIQHLFLGHWTPFIIQRTATSLFERGVRSLPVAARFRRSGQFLSQQVIDGLRIGLAAR